MEQFQERFKRESTESRESQVSQKSQVTHENRGADQVVNQGVSQMSLVSHVSQMSQDNEVSPAVVSPHKTS